MVGIAGRYISIASGVNAPIAPSTVKNETAEAIADIKSSGETLRANHLKILSDGLILKSQACLLRARGADVSADEGRDLADLLDKLGL